MRAQTVNRSFAIEKASTVTVREFMLNYESGGPVRLNSDDADGLTELFRLSLSMNRSDDADSLRTVIRKLAAVNGVQLKSVMGWPMSRLAGISSTISLKA